MKTPDDAESHELTKQEEHDFAKLRERQSRDRANLLTKYIEELIRTEIFEQREVEALEELHATQRAMAKTIEESKAYAKNRDRNHRERRNKTS